MVKENFTNFATTTLATSSISSGATSFAVSSGQGALFPSSNFTITMDTEILFITSRSTDTFTVGTRGFDGSAAASHTSGATIQLCTTAYTHNHLWQNVADTFTPLVPPAALGNTASVYDHEFEVGGNASWVLYPSSGLPAGTTFSIGTPLASHLLLNRGTSDTTLYTAYVPFTVTPPFVVTAKLSQSATLLGTTGSTNVTLFVCDQTNPPASMDGGNRIRLDTTIQTQQTGSWLSLPATIPQIVTTRMVKDVSGSGSQIGPSFFTSPGQPSYIRISCTSGYLWTIYMGDGVTYWPITNTTQSFTVRTLGVFMNTSTPLQTVAIDYIRVVTGTFPTVYGN